MDIVFVEVLKLREVICVLLDEVVKKVIERLFVGYIGSFSYILEFSFNLGKYLDVSIYLFFL